MKKCLFSMLLLCCAHTFCIRAQHVITFDTLFQRAMNQIHAYPQEKIHLHIDRGVFVPGDTVWVKAYLVHATFHTRIEISRYVLVELINPLDSLISRVKLRVNGEHSFNGYIPLPYQLPDGRYTLRAYTSYMMEEGEESFFQRKISVVSPRWLNTKTSINCRLNGKRRGLVGLDIRNFYGEKLPLTKGRVCLKHGKMKEVMVTDSSVMIGFSDEEIASNRAMLVDVTETNGNRMMKFFPVSSGNVDFDVTFYPEGGYLLTGQECRMAFKALDRCGNAVDVKVAIFDSHDNQVADASVFYQGMGRISFCPQVGESYYALCTVANGLIRKKVLPQAQVGIYGLRVDTDEKNLKVKLVSAFGAPKEPLLIIAHVRGVVVFAEWWSENVEELVLRKKNFPPGIIQILLLDGQMNILGERLSFCYHGQMTRATVQMDKDFCSPKDEVTMKIGLSDVRRTASLSVSVTDLHEVVPDTCSTIVSNLLLTSELKGYIENPSFYLQNNERARQALDLLMMIHGWRRYDLSAVARGEIEKAERTPETSFTISGRVKRLSPFELKKRYIFSFIGVGSDYGKTIIVEKDGYFRLSDIEYQDGFGVQLQAVSIKNNSRGTQYIMVDEEDFPLILAGVPQQWPSETVEANAEFILPLESGMRNFLLPTLEVKAPYWGTVNYEKMDNKMVNSSGFKNMKDLIRSMGIRIVSKSQGDITCFFYNKTRVIICVDGKYQSNNYEQNLIYDTPLSDIGEINFLKDVEREMALGFLKVEDTKKKYFLYKEFQIPASRKTIPILNIKTYDFIQREAASHKGKKMPIKKRRELTLTSANYKTIYPLGYQKPMEFYTPVYDTLEKREKDSDDYRKTIFWKPNITINLLEPMSIFSFYAANKESVYLIKIEGITDEGDIISETRYLTVHF